MKIPGVLVNSIRRLTGEIPDSRIAANAAWLFSDKLLRMAVNMVLGIWLARHLGVSQYGQLSYVFAYVSLFGAIAAVGLDKIVVRDIVRDRQRASTALGSAFILKLAGGLLAALLAILIIGLMHPADGLTRLMVAIVAAGMIFQATDVIDFWFQSQVASRYTIYAKTTAFLLLSLIKIFLITYGAGLIAFVWAALAEMALASAGLVAVFRYTKGSLEPIRYEWCEIKRLLQHSWPLLLSGIAIILYMRIDQVMLANMAGQHEVGLYSAALKLSEAWYIVPMVVMSSLMPAITTAKTQAHAEYRKLMEKSFTRLALAAYVVAIPITLFSRPLIELLYGPEYEGAATILAIHIWSALFVFMGVAQSPWMVNEGLTRTSLLYTSCGAVINVILNYMLIPTLGTIGCAIATTISYGFSGWLANMLYRKTRGIFFMQSRAILLGVGK